MRTFLYLVIVAIGIIVSIPITIIIIAIQQAKNDVDNIRKHLEKYK